MLDQNDIDIERADEIHEALKRGHAVRDVAKPWESADAQRVLDLVIDDFIGELNRVIAGHGRPYGMDGSRFLRQYRELWVAKLALGK